MKYKNKQNTDARYRKFREAFPVFVSLAVIILFIPGTKLYEKTLISYSVPIGLISGAGILGFILTSNKINSFNNFLESVLFNFFTWGLLALFLFVGMNYYLATKSIRKYTLPISKRYLEERYRKVAPAAIAEVDYMNFSHSFRFDESEMERVNNADSISVEFTDGLFGYTVISEYHLKEK